MSYRSKRLGIIAMAAALSLSLVACGGANPAETNEPQATQEEQQAPEEEQWVPVVKLGSGSTQLRLENKLGAPLAAAYLKPSDSSEWPKELSFEGLAVKADDLFEIDYTPISANTPYDVWFTSSDGTVYEAKQVTFSNVGDGVIAVKTADGVTFFEYDDATGTKVSTKEAALAIKAAEEKAAEEARKKAEEEAAVAAAAEEEAASEYYESDYSYDESYSDGYYEESYSWDSGSSYDAGSVAQEEDGCLSDMF